MSTYPRQTKHPKTGEWHEAIWMDDYYGNHRYGVKFPNGNVFDPSKVKLVTRDSEPVKTNYVDSRTPEEREADSKIKGTMTTAGSLPHGPVFTVTPPRRGLEEHSKEVIIEQIDICLTAEDPRYQLGSYVEMLREGIIKHAEQEMMKKVVGAFVFRDVEYTSLDRMSQVSRDNYFYNLSLNQVKADLLTSLEDTNPK